MDNELAVLGAALLLAGLFARAGRRLGVLPGEVVSAADRRVPVE